MYSVTVVLKRIWKRKAGNLITMLQVYIGTALVILSFGILQFTQSENKELLENSKDKIYTIRSEKKSSAPASYIITGSQFELLHDTAHLKTSVAIRYDIITFAGRSHIENDEEITDRYVVTFSEEAKQISAEREFLEILPMINKDNTINWADINFGCITDAELFNDGEQYVHSCVLPIELYWETAIPSNFSVLSISIVCDDYDHIGEIFDLEQVLSGSHEYNFKIDSEFYDFLEKAAFARSFSARILIFSIILLIVVFISIVYVFLLLIEERSFEIAVCRASGAMVRTIISEFALELLLISFIPTALSILTIVLVFKNGFEFVYLMIPKINYIVFLIAILGVVLADAVCLIPIAFKIYRSKPYELLVSEG